jgi:hypothetical protein
MTPFTEYTRMVDGVLLADNGERLQTEPRDLFWIGMYGGLDEVGGLLLPVSYVFNPDTSRYWRVHGPERAAIVRGLNAATATAVTFPTTDGQANDRRRSDARALRSQTRGLDVLPGLPDEGRREVGAGAVHQRRAVGRVQGAAACVHDPAAQRRRGIDGVG